MAGMIPMCPWLFVYMVAGREGETSRNTLCQAWAEQRELGYRETGQPPSLFASTDSIPTFSASLLRSYKKERERENIKLDAFCT